MDTAGMRADLIRMLLLMLITVTMAPVTLGNLQTQQVESCDSYSRLVVDEDYNGVSQFLSLFERHPDHRLSAIPLMVNLPNSSTTACAESCVTLTTSECKAFDFDNLRKQCYLFGVNLYDPDVHLIPATGRDDYQPNYLRLFQLLPRHRLPATIDRRIDEVSREECARRCVMEMQFKCRGMNYIDSDYPACMLVSASPALTAGTSYDEFVDYYQRIPEGPLGHFVNYGAGVLKLLDEVEVYQEQVTGIPLEECAAQCLAQKNFNCYSFDYVHNGIRSVCKLSKYIAAHVYGLQGPYASVSHYELIGDSMSYFYATPHTTIPGHDLKTFSKVTPNRCARHCMEENAFVCRSFDYHILDGTCVLSDTTGSDIGGLYSSTTAEVHYFEMKPILDCGGLLSSSKGDLASPNWPRNYAHHLHCVWNITTTRDKVIELKFTHFELGLQSSDPCSDHDDRLIVGETGLKPYCIRPNTDSILTRSNHVSLTFITNSQGDAQGFRAFYTAEWTCVASLSFSPGEFASPRWPESYPPSQRCTWRLESPLNHRIRLHFTSFELEKHTLGHCNEEFDHVKILDGGTVHSPLIGLYCGYHPPFTVSSTGRDMLVQFASDHDPDNSRQGFHAKFVFEFLNGTVDLPPGMDTDLYVDLDALDPLAGSDEHDTEETGDEEGGTDELRAEGVNSEAAIVADHSYRTTMWTFITLLLLALISTLILLVLVIRHYRQKLSRHTESIVEDGRPLMQAELLFRRPKQNNLGNEVNLLPGGAGVIYCPEVASSAGEEATEGATGASADVEFEPGDFGKYSKDNAKNINLETKEVKEVNT